MRILLRPSAIVVVEIVPLARAIACLRGTVMAETRKVTAVAPGMSLATFPGPAEGRQAENSWDLVRARPHVDSSFPGPPVLEWALG